MGNILQYIETGTKFGLWGTVAGPAYFLKRFGEIELKKRPWKSPSSGLSVTSDRSTMFFADK